MHELEARPQRLTLRTAAEAGHRGEGDERGRPGWTYYTCVATSETETTTVVVTSKYEMTTFVETS